MVSRRDKPVDRLAFHPYSPRSQRTIMGQQLNKIEKRRRRANYLERKKVKAKEARVAPAKPRVRKAPAKKKAEPKTLESAAAAE